MAFLITGVTSEPLDGRFSIPAAYGDLLAAALTLVALLALLLDWTVAIPLVWIFNVFGALDLLNALFQGLRYTADEQLGARIGVTAMLHSWGSALTHHPHVHCIVPGDGISVARGEESASSTETKESERWVSCRPGFFLPVRVLSRLFRRLFLEKLAAAHEAGRLRFFNDLARLHDRGTFADHLAPLRKIEWVVYAKPPFGGPEAVLAYLSRYTHRVAIANSRLIALDDKCVSFKWKDYRAKARHRQKIMTLATSEFIRRFLMLTAEE